MAPYGLLAPVAENPPSASSSRQSGQTGFLKTSPTFFSGRHPSQRTILHFGQIQSLGFRNPPISRPHREQNPLTYAVSAPPL